MCLQYDHEPNSISTEYETVQCIDKAKLVEKTKADINLTPIASTYQEASDNRPNKPHRIFKRETTAPTIPVPGFVLYRGSPPISAKRGTKAEESRLEEQVCEDTSKHCSGLAPASILSWIVICNRLASKLKKESSEKGLGGRIHPDNALKYKNTTIFPCSSTSLPVPTAAVLASDELEGPEECESSHGDSLPAQRLLNLTNNVNEPAQECLASLYVSSSERDTKARMSSEREDNLMVEAQPIIRDFAYNQSVQQSSDNEYFSATEGDE